MAGLSYLIDAFGNALGNSVARAHRTSAERSANLEAGKAGLTEQQLNTLKQRSTDHDMSLDDLLIARGQEARYGYLDDPSGRFVDGDSYTLAAENMTSFAGVSLEQLEAEAVKQNLISQYDSQSSSNTVVPELHALRSKINEFYDKLDISYELTPGLSVKGQFGSYQGVTVDLNWRPV